jgi:hypothetical protein
MFDIEAEVAPPCITGHLPAEFVSFPLIFVSYPVRVSGVGKPARLRGCKPIRLRDGHRYFQGCALFSQRRFRLAPGILLQSVLNDEIK